MVFQSAMMNVTDVNVTDVYSAPTPLITDYIHSSVLLLLIILGVPLNLVVSRKLWTSYRTGAKSAAEIAQLPFLILKIHTNISDLLILLLFAPTYFGWLLTYAWLGGDVLCRVMHCAFVFIFALSSNLVACIAIDRLLGVNSMKKPAGAGGTRVTALKVIVPSAYIIALLVALPQTFIYRTVEVDPDFPQCVTWWTMVKYQQSIQLGRQVNVLYTGERAYQISHLLAVFWIPSLVTWLCYGVVIKKLLSYSGSRTQFQSSARPTNATNHDNNTKRTESAGDSLIELKNADGDKEGVEVSVSLRTRTPLRDRVLRVFRRSNGAAGDNWQTSFRNKVLMTTAPVIIGHLVCWAPYNIMAILPLFWPQVAFIKSGYIDLLECLIAFNAVIDPFLYGAFARTTNQ